MTAKMGRPSSDNPKNTRIGIRLDNDTLRILEECCEKESKSKSTIVREGIELVAKKLSVK